MTNFFIYILGSVLVGAGLIYGAYALGLGETWMIVIGLIVLGFGIMAGVKKTQAK
jgi:hypothetical protein